MADVVIGKVGLTPKGVYNASTTYDILDVVRYGVDSWVSKVNNNTGHAPAEGDYWQKMTDAYNSAEGAIAVQQAANSAAAAANALTAMQTAIESLPDGTAVTATVAEHTVELQDKPDYDAIFNADADDADFDKLPKLCGQPMILFGNGTPQEAIVPDNWIQFLDGGYNWNGTPSALGQQYVNTAASSGAHYVSVRNGEFGLKWVNS